MLPDLQGPLDTAELLRGSEIYVDICNDLELLAKALGHDGSGAIGFARHLLSYTSDGPEGFGRQHATVIRGQILIRDDSAIMISPAMYRRHVAPYDEMVLGGLGGGGIHACGKMEHNADEFFALPSICCLDFGQPELNNVDAIYAKAQQRKIAMIRVCVPREELVTGRVMKRFPTGVSLVYEADSLDDARAVMAAYHEVTE